MMWDNSLHMHQTTNQMHDYVPFVNILLKKRVIFLYSKITLSLEKHAYECSSDKKSSLNITRANFYVLNMIHRSPKLDHSNAHPNYATFVYTIPQKLLDTIFREKYPWAYKTEI
jgi:hypothetical protein